MFIAITTKIFKKQKKYDIEGHISNYSLNYKVILENNSQNTRKQIIYFHPLQDVKYPN